MTLEAEVIDAANQVCDLVEDWVTREAETTRPKLQVHRDKHIAAPARVIRKLVKARFRAQSKAVTDSHALRSLYVTLNRTGNNSRRLSSGIESDGSRHTAGGTSLQDWNGRRAIREDVAGSCESSGQPAQHASRGEGEAVRRVTGSTDAPLTDAGRKQGHDLKQRTGDIEVFTAPNSRSRETGRIVNPGAKDANWLKPWGVGKYEGWTLDAAREPINRLVLEAPDESPGTSRYSGAPGDTFNEVAARLINGAMQQRRALRPGQRVLNITSGRAIHIIHAAALKGFEGIDKDELVNNPDFSKPGDLFLLTHRGMRKVDKAIGGQQFFAQHGETDWNEGTATSESLREADDEKLTRDQVILEANNALSAIVTGQPVTGDEQKLYADAITKALNAGNSGVSDHLGVAQAEGESFISEYLKDAGFSQLTGEIDKTTVDRLAFAIADAYEAGKTFDQTVEAIQSEFTDMTRYRAQMIAQTELNDAYNQSVMHFGEQAGATRKSWQTDAAPCPTCIDNALQGEIDFDEDFDSGDDAPPAHPNCMCSLLVHANN